MIEELFTKLENWTWSSAVVGLGYVGLPLVVTQSRAGVPVTGFDVKESVIDSLSAGRSHIDDIADDELAEIDARFTSDPAKLSEADVIFICVPTPLAVGKLPDISYIERAGETIAASLRRGQLVILESTTYPGTTEDTLRPILEKSGLKLEDDFLLAYAPERVDPANARRTSRASSGARRREAPPPPSSSTGASSRRCTRSRTRARPRWRSCSRIRSAGSTSRW